MMNATAPAPAAIAHGQCPRHAPSTKSNVKAATDDIVRLRQSRTFSLNRSRVLMGWVLGSIATGLEHLGHGRGLA